jgi:hypothetical protein
MSRCVLSYPRRHAVGEELSEGSMAAQRDRLDEEGKPKAVQWEERNIAVHGVLAANLPRLGEAHPISKSMFTTGSSG